MSTPWFDADAWSWLPGTLYGCLGGVWGAVAGTLAVRGKARGFVLGSGLALVAVAVVLLTLAVVGLCVGQPYFIWFGLGLPGLQGVILGVIFTPIILARYREAEERRMSAEDLQP